MGKIIAITNQKGGVGKTTTTVNLAAALGYLDRKILIVDIDAQGNATQGLGLDKVEISKSNKHAYSMLMADGKNPKSFVIETKWKNVSCIPSDDSLVTFGTQYEGVNNKEKVLKKCLDKLKSDYDYILIDCPPSLSAVTINGLAAANSVIIPVQSEFYALEGMTQLLNSIKTCKNHLNKSLYIEGLLMTMYSANTNLSSGVLEEVKKFFGNYVYDTIIRRNITLAEAPSYGIPIIYYDAHSNGSIDYLKLAEEVISNE